MGTDETVALLVRVTRESWVELGPEAAMNRLITLQLDHDDYPYAPSTIVITSCAVDECSCEGRAKEARRGGGREGRVQDDCRDEDNIR